MRLNLILIVSTLTFYQAHSQNTILRTYGGSSSDGGSAVCKTNDGGYFIIGSTQSYGAGNGDVYLLKTNSVGDTLWTKTYGGIDYDGGTSAKQTTDGGFIIAGRTKSFGAGSDDVYVIKTNNVGDSLWTRTYGMWGSEVGNSIEETYDGGYIICGTTSSIWPAALAYLVKINSVGDTLWTKTFLGISNTTSTCVIQTSDSGYVLTGGTSTAAGDTRILLIKTDGNGNLIWMRFFGPGSVNYGHSVLQSADGGYIILGMTSNSAGGIKLMKTDSNGLVVWQKNYEGGINGVTALAQSSDGGYLITGAGGPVNPCSFGFNIYLIRTNSFGDTILTRAYVNPADRYYAYSVTATNDNGYAIAGYTTLCAGGSANVFLMIFGTNDTDINDNLSFLFPNPATDEIKISGSNIERVEIFNTLGEKVHTSAGTSRTSVETINISALSSGIYFVRVKSETGEKVAKFVKQ